MLCRFLPQQYGFGFECFGGIHSSIVAAYEDRGNVYYSSRREAMRERNLESGIENEELSSHRVRNCRTIFSPCGRLGTTGTCAIVLLSFALAGCDSLRFTPSEQQKQNAWLHNKTAGLAAETAKQEQTSEKLQTLTDLSEEQSRAFVSYYGLPEEFPKAETVEDVLGEASRAITQAAISESAQRPDAWQVADSALELGIAVCGLFGGVFGVGAVQFLKDARTKSQALQEIISGNELFKKQNASAVVAFKSAQSSQSPQTRQIVAGMKG